MLEQLKQDVYQANLDLVKHGLVIFTWGNVSGIDETRQYVVIKPSGVKYEDMKAEDMVVVDLAGQVIEGSLNPSSDTMTHVELYKQFPSIKGVVHTHSKWATTYSQLKRPIPPLGTTHADYFNQAIPVTRPLELQEIRTDYEWNTGKVIVETFTTKNINPLHCPAVLVHEHGPFAWGDSVHNAVHNAVVLEYLADMAYHIEVLQDATPINQDLLNKHFNRKHGKDAYYGQKL
ncbi:L-ribulose-5-phosphate 4-epimerase [Candidatus Xianfuyuplasma coldseepsis]|uniref:L-ribulose-5-phosphate 4-epimerase n=1 Tax=Candidatus Xianfuyuplasma coldseepsis TaxID=2782163 RepID=A0A7L7KUV8_9MOLU|nr:L-ribulose-5-phosphate 4-epimerase [Xianfuyuplasma coldseepsis]QMS85784.1 L-ribulose-5-phosphate 4-epimerase [Xianfuyuplasma coldseepsis]